MLHLTFNYKLKPTAKQIEIIEHNLAVCKSVWNHALYERKLWYNSRSCPIDRCSLNGEYIVKPFEYPNYHAQSAELTQAKKTNDFLKSGNAQAMQQTLRKLDRAFNDMKSKGLGFPRYKKIMKSFNVLGKPTLEGNHLKMPLLKSVKLIKSRDIPEGFVIKQVQIIKKASGYYANLMIELDVDVVQPIAHGHAMGIDVGIGSMIATSDGLVIPRPSFLDKTLRKIQLLQRKLRNKIIGSGKWKKLHHRISLLHEAVANSRKDYHFKLAHQLCDGVGMIFVEDINFNSWSRGLFSKQSLDMGIGQFFNILEYVCSQTDTYFERVDKDYSSQICPNCGTHTGKKPLNLRVHKCPECGYEKDRDIAAAEVIRNRGLQNMAVGTIVMKQPSNGVLTGTKV
ncbi:transposase IS891/IS1136/IS1341 family [Cyanobacterium stanieri PCC 7202]|uniref:Transposase IS891/IS1136/IS1341 family n=1 Tax=Cyanobacterium stanieri (strain ATCC 29140 / PCC 7202) TaxID=292563 RepID=K9YQC8_CYASC|nr:transposase IS891/IS1136/IS1341 family [Cyanobacterium stanieri PCC 7202]